MQDRLAGAAQTQTGNRLNYRHITQVEALGHFRISWREGKALDLLHRSDRVPVGTSHRDAARALGDCCSPHYMNQGG